MEKMGRGYRPDGEEEGGEDGGPIGYRKLICDCRNPMAGALEG